MVYTLVQDGHIVDHLPLDVRESLLDLLNDRLETDYIPFYSDEE